MEASVKKGIDFSFFLIYNYYKIGEIGVYMKKLVNIFEENYIIFLVYAFFGWIYEVVWIYFISEIGRASCRERV